MTSTEIIKLDPQNPEKRKILYAAQILRRGGLVIFPTETVYGIGANLLKEATIRRLYQIKQRSPDKPFSIHISRKEEAENYASDIPAVAYRLMDKFWPGPLTLILKSNSGSVGLRFPDNEIAQRLIKSAEVPIVAPSANISDAPPPINFEDAIRGFKGLVELGIDGGRTKFGRESTIVDVRLMPAKIVREGAIKREDIEDILNKKVILFVCTGNSCRSVMAKFYLEKRLKELGRQDIEVLSRGIAAYEGLGATPEVKQILEEQGIDS
ncbi:MAG: L-threonylcarbamoyladenylate synthase, partial [Candidatus Omnitrophica bacterium]|nr:L-threonylcarbamoyladenylate synthase [Candidatus Omnitrophota bacterium]